MKIYKITEASEYLGVSINTLKTLANNGKIKSFKTTGKHRRFHQDDLDAYMGVEKEKQEKKYEEELAEDIMKILTCYSARFYGRRGGRKKKNTAKNEANESNGI
jgi:excisionase family DNA binding protein